MTTRAAFLLGIAAPFVVAFLILVIRAVYQDWRLRLLVDAEVVARDVARDVSCAAVNRHATETPIPGRIVIAMAAQDAVNVAMSTHTDAYHAPKATRKAAR